MLLLAGANMAFLETAGNKAWREGVKHTHTQAECVRGGHRQWYSVLARTWSPCGDRSRLPAAVPEMMRSCWCIFSRAAAFLRAAGRSFSLSARSVSTRREGVDK